MIFIGLKMCPILLRMPFTEIQYLFHIISCFHSWPPYSHMVGLTCNKVYIPLIIELLF